MLTLALSLMMHATSPEMQSVTPIAHHQPVQGRGRRIWGTCHGAGTMCDAGHCCPGLSCVEETQGKICRKPEAKEDDATAPKKRK